MRFAGLLVAGLTCTTAATSMPPITIVAHRGLAEGVPENTLAAIRQSLERGIKVIEIDLRTTKDGQLVVLHDPTLDRTTDCSGAVNEMTLARIKVCEVGRSQHRSERVPTLSEAIDLVASSKVRLLLDCKSAPIAAVLSEVRAHHAEAKVILGLRSRVDVAHAHRELPGATILAFIPAISDGLAYVQAGADIIRLWSDWVEADPALVDRTQLLGKPVWIMVGRHLPSKSKDWRALHGRMIATGAEGLITNRPDLIPAQ